MNLNNKTFQYYFNIRLSNLHTISDLLNRALCNLLRPQALWAKIMLVFLFMYCLDCCRLQKNFSTVRHLLNSKTLIYYITLILSQYVVCVYINIYVYKLIYIFAYRKVIVLLHCNASWLKQPLHLILHSFFPSQYLNVELTAIFNLPFIISKSWGRFKITIQQKKSNN